MVITIDTSALLAVLLNEQHRSVIIEVTKGHNLQAPASLDAEVGNALTAMFRRNRLRLADAEQVLDQFSKIPIRRTSLRLDKAVQLANKYGIYAYDAYMLDCARQYRSPLLSLDDQLIEVGKQMKLNLLEIPL